MAPSLLHGTKSVMEGQYCTDTLAINPGLSEDNIYAFSRSGRVNMRVEIDGGGHGRRRTPGYRPRRPAPGPLLRVSEE
ncbi:hypothetical protein [Streptomyces alboniger]|uniref:Uncharacterized protein n=1 Tax=Streptomyces alboniger TaxID=132473 RepID=A0A5J6HCU6_STRAD|nr:hypothetical protein [Streptomyces alboniger]QEV16263.1 hypothetical protein CP975_00935 [Streptomyces alboniger]